MNGKKRERGDVRMPLSVSFKEHCLVPHVLEKIFQSFGTFFDEVGHHAELKLDRDHETTVFLIQLFCEVPSLSCLLAPFLPL